MAKGMQLACCDANSKAATGDQAVQRDHCPRWQMAIHLLESCSSYRLQPDVISFNATMSSCEKAQQWQQALLVFETIFKDAKIQPNPVSFNTAISSLPGGWPRALLLIDQAQHQADVMSFNAAMSCCKKDAAWREAVGILDAMIFMTLSPNLVTYNTAISCCENDGEWQTALRLLEAIDESRMEADVISFSAAISSHAKMGRWEEAISLFDEMKRQKLQLDVICFGNAMTSCAKFRQWQAALALLETGAMRIFQAWLLGTIFS
ncbi:unnamed protein product [Cladocopium goreaui]|uniref:Pentatricopeptide repeat-containing protein GUN1, chloroplastic (Pentatricopeptide repeat-containing protein At2g31400) (Protein GENOMES UNCOUPLED 1) n=1 Tax=Cladocopium goreaui TaxID=2562237 RepID=A0A9P1C7A9_9DINO|nr:unnamed protein product [Cladocopium goreaui]